MKIAIEDSLIATLKPEWAERTVQLTQAEKATLRVALQICAEAGELQAKINQAQEIPAENNDYEWARIYLADILD